jgi:hypothetical protein
MVCWDRVFPLAWTAADQQAVVNHKSVLYVLSPPMDQQKTVACSTATLTHRRADDPSGCNGCEGRER